jgi:hypothetical protein
MLKGHHGDHHLAAVYRSQLKARTQLRGKTLLKFAGTIKHLSHQAFVWLPEVSSRGREHIFLSRVKGRK